MSTETNKRIVTHVIEHISNAGDAIRLEDLCSPEMAEEVRGLHNILNAAFPDLTVAVEDMIAEDDKVVARLVFRGVHQGEFRGLPPTHRSVAFSAIRIYRISDDRIVEMWANQDVYGLLRQLDAV